MTVDIEGPYKPIKFECLLSYLLVNLNQVRNIDRIVTVTSASGINRRGRLVT
jgi:spore coat polysaccharide biosynthesis protein SpsF (cytidylyltransferase family)